MHNFSDDQIREFKMHRKFVVICDGYDESKLVVNIHTFNLFNRPGQWDVKLVISCRSQYLSQDYRGRFIPQGGVHYDRLAPDLFQEAVIAPFSREQIHNYVDQYVPLEPRTWSTGDYMDKLTTIPNLMDLVKNPFLLTLALEALPGVTEGKQDLSTMKITRVQLYDTFVRHWLNVNKRRLEAGVFSKEEHDILDQLLEADFTLLGIEYSMRLAFAIFNKQDGNPIVQYVHLKDKESWKAEFFSPDPEVRFLRDSSPLARSGRLHRFLHRSILEYFFSCTFYDSNTVDKDNTEFALQPPSSSTGLLGPISDHPLSQRSLMSEPSIIQFLAERVQSNLTFKQQLLNIIELSKTDAQASQAAANAITILVKAGIRFSEADLKGIRVPGSNLSGGEFDSTQLQGADLSNANLTKTWLRKANLSGAMMTGTNFGEWPYVKEEDHILSCAFSSDGKTFLVGLFNWQVKVYETKNWGLVHTLVGHTHNVNKVAISSNGLKIASASDDKTVRLWEARTGQAGHVLSGHEGQVSGVAFSPNNQQVASCGWDSTIRLWNVATGESGAVFQGHYTVVSSVAFSPSGLQIASTSWDETVRIWDVHSGNAVRTLTGHSDGVASVAFSPDGIHLASSGWDKTIRVWNASTGLQELVMSGHTSSIATVDYSSDGQHLVSSSEDNTVRVWGSRTGAPGPTLNGHTGGTTCAVFSPSGKYIASSSFDKTVRLWDTNPDAYTTTTSTGHTRNVNTVSYSPCGLQILSSSWDATARLWDAELGTPGTVFRGHTRGVWRAVH
ncbi:hypothetical protein BGX23_011677 [Mortierella sp. AD031]|nr:hypothetical protein BGX23_011677 [Mortierella sp. AD031]